MNKQERKKKMIISLDSGTIHIPTDAEYIEPRRLETGPKKDIFLLLIKENRKCLKT